MKLSPIPPSLQVAACVRDGQLAITEDGILFEYRGGRVVHISHDPRIVSRVARCEWSDEADRIINAHVSRDGKIRGHKIKIPFAINRGIRLRAIARVCARNAEAWRVWGGK